MPTELKSPVLDEYLGRVRSHLPLRRGRDIVRELESSVRDRVDDLAAAEGRSPDDELVRRALAELGEPEKVAVAYDRERSLVGPADFRAFLASTAVVFAVHLALLGVATTLGRALQFGPLSVLPPGPDGLVDTAAAVLHALCLDVGLMVILFAGTRGLRRRIVGASATPSIDVSPRVSLGRIGLSVVVAVVLNLFRDRVFVVVTGHETHPLFTEWFVEVLPMINAVLALAVVSDVLYFVFRETRLTVAVDALHGLAALACMLFLLEGGPILALPGIERFGHIYGPMNDFLADLGELMIGFLALVFAAKTVRRLIRIAQI